MQYSSHKAKKLILKALPYALFAYVGNKLGYAFRIAEGKDVSEKLLPFFNNIGTSFARVFPSFHPLDILVGIVVGAGMWLVMYIKAKNRKKFRQGEEYGSAKWGEQRDIEPYMDTSNFFNNVILTMTEFLTMGRPSSPKFARNKNILVIGGSGSGKTRFFVKPNLMQMHSSYVVTDPKGTVLVECGKMLKRGRPKRDGQGKVVYATDSNGNAFKDKNGKPVIVYEPYNIKVFNTIDFAKSMHYKHGITSMYLTGDSPDEERSSAKKNLVSGKYRFIFVVDIYNEGVDIPEINTVLFLRPTESLTVFLQQLGRGLRLAEDKECLTVLDFIGQANKKYNFEQKFAALLSNTDHNVERELKNGFVSVPKGCYIQLEKKAAKYILDNIRASYGNTTGLVNRISTFEEDTGLPLTLSNFLGYYHIDPRTMYKYSTFTMLCERAGVSEHSAEPADEYIQKALLRLCTIDSRRLIDFLIYTLPNIKNINISDMPKIEQRMMQMFYITIWLTSAEDWNSEEVKNNISSLADSPDNMRELTELLKYKYDMIDFIDEPVDLGFDCPLDLHCTYTRDQLLVALDYMTPSKIWGQGVKWLPEKKIDVFFVTLNKSDKDYSPTTMYNDYSINEVLFHWQSQSTTSETSATGRRYIEHRQNGSRILLFVREFKSDRVSGGAAAYTFLGTARYVSHTGSRPMNITWKLDRPIPAKFLKKTNKLVVG